MSKCLPGKGTKSILNKNRVGDILKQGTLTEYEGSVQLTSALSKLVLLKRLKSFY
jgi:hypothetical protein